MPRETKQVLLQNGLELIFKNGFNNTGIQEILKAAGVPKGSFYHFFKSKEDFGIQVLEYYAAQSKDFMASIFENTEQSPMDRLRVFFEEGRKKMACPESRRGCLVGNMTQEMGTLSPAFEACLEEKWATVKNYLADCLRQAKEQGELLNDEDHESLAEFLLISWQGAMMRLKVSPDTAPLDNFISVTFKSLLRLSAPASV